MAAVLARMGSEDEDAVKSFSAPRVPAAAICLPPRKRLRTCLHVGGTSESESEGDRKAEIIVGV